MRSTLRIPIYSKSQETKILKAEDLLHEAGVIFDTGTDIEAKPRVREWEFDTIEGAKLVIQVSNME